MATRRVELGPVGEALARNLKHLREARQLRLDDLAELLAQAGRPLSKTTLSQIETGGRRVDVDDLVTIAQALRVEIADLLASPSTSEFRAAVEHAEAELTALHRQWGAFLDARSAISLLTEIDTDHPDPAGTEATADLQARAESLARLSAEDLLTHLQESHPKPGR
ncbi:hypothetical protein C5E05_19335 [Pseudoclavibacter sp. AY1H1]|nr:hypothetical protein C5E05_19335 [Pseudoclavibacter sp. AY1H1]